MKNNINAVPEPGSSSQPQQEKSPIPPSMEWLERIREKREQAKREQRQQQIKEAAEPQPKSIFKSGYTPGYAPKQKLEKSLIEAHLETRPEIKSWTVRGNIEKEHRIFKDYFPKAGSRRFFETKDLRVRIKELEREKFSASPSRQKEIRKQITALKKVV